MEYAGNLVIEGSAANTDGKSPHLAAIYEARVKALCNRMARTKAGLGLLLSLNHRARGLRVLVRPVVPEDDHEGAFATFYRPPGTYFGALVGFTPFQDYEGIVGETETLFHEVFHALRWIIGAEKDRRDTKDAFHTTEEVLAIAAANFIRLEQGLGTLRIDHRLMMEGKKTRSVVVPADDAGRRFSKYRPAFLKMRARQPDLYRFLAALRPKGYEEHLYNPFRNAEDPKAAWERVQKRMDSML